MSPHLSEEQVGLYRRRALAADALLQASQHLMECEKCRARIAPPSELYAGVEAVRAVLKAAAGPAHLTYPEMAAYVDKQLADEDAAEIEQHTRECRACNANLGEMEALWLEMQPPKRPAWLERVSGIWRETLSWKGAFLLAGATACAALILFVVREPVQEAPKQVAIAQPKAVRQAEALAGLEKLPVALQAAITRAISARQIEPPAVLVELSGRRGVLLGSPAAGAGVDLVDPIGIVVETQMPTLQWKPIAGAEYKASIFAEHFEEVAASGWTRNAEWRVPHALKPGARYSWQLRVRRNGVEFTAPAPPAPEARFRILDPAGEAEIAQLRTASQDSHLVLGIGYAQLGVLDEAERELRQAQQQNPDSSGVAALLASVERMRNPKP